MSWETLCFFWKGVKVQPKSDFISGYESSHRDVVPLELKLLGMTWIIYSYTLCKIEKIRIET